MDACHRPRRTTDGCCGPGTPWTGTSRNRWTFLRWPRSPAAPRRLHPLVQGDLRRDTAPLPAAPSRGTGDVPAAHHRPTVTDICMRRAGSPASEPSAAPSATIVGESPSEFRRRGPMPPSAVVLRAQAWTRPSSFGEAAPQDVPVRSSAMFNNISRSTVYVTRPGRGPRLLRRQARPRGRHRPRPGLHALADRPRARRRGPRDPARASRPAVDGRGDGRRRSASC